MPSEDTSDVLAAYYFKQENEKICGISVTSITDEYVDEYPTVVERFFTRYYYIQQDSEPIPYKVLFHSNRICLICLPTEHPALKEGISCIKFDIGNLDRSKNSVRGKGKKGGMALQPDSTLALLTTNTKKIYKIPSCIRAKLVEVNNDLTKKAQLLETVAEGENYIAILLPKPEHCEEIKNNLLTEQQYKNWLEEKSLEVNENNTQNELKTINELESVDNVM